jgi:hypothetical protein
VVVEGFEIVQIALAGNEVAAARKQPLDVFRDRDVAGQKGQRIGMPRRST